jgi:hypothetical protein
MVGSAARNVKIGGMPIPLSHSLEARIMPKLVGVPKYRIHTSLAAMPSFKLGEKGSIYADMDPLKANFALLA